jgi:hypothetical protein
MVHFQGIIASGNTANGTIIMTIPSGFRPIVQTPIPITSVAGSNRTLFLQVDGRILINGALETVSWYGFNASWSTI